MNPARRIFVVGSIFFLAFAAVLFSSFVVRAATTDTAAKRISGADAMCTDGPIFVYNCNFPARDPQAKQCMRGRPCEGTRGGFHVSGKCGAKPNDCVGDTWYDSQGKPHPLELNNALKSAAWDVGSAPSETGTSIPQGAPVQDLSTNPGVNLSGQTIPFNTATSLPPPTQTAPSGESQDTKALPLPESVRTLPTNGFDPANSQKVESTPPDKGVDSDTEKTDLSKQITPVPNSTFGQTAQQSSAPAETRPQSMADRLENFSSGAKDYLKQFSTKVKSAFGWGEVTEEQGGVPTSNPDTQVAGTVGGVTFGTKEFEPNGTPALCFTNGDPCIRGNSNGIPPRVDPDVFLKDPMVTPVKGIVSNYNDIPNASQIPGGAQSNPYLFGSAYLPLGTVVTVCGNGNQCVDGVIGDVGPNLKYGRVIDMSEQAQQEIGINPKDGLGSGTVYVKGVLTGGNSTETVTAGLAAVNQSKQTGQDFSTSLQNYQQDTGSRIALSGPASSIIPVSGPKGSGWTVPDQSSAVIAFDPNAWKPAPNTFTLSPSSAADYKIYNDPIPPILVPPQQQSSIPEGQVTVASLVQEPDYQKEFEQQQRLLDQQEQQRQDRIKRAPDGTIDLDSVPDPNQPAPKVTPNSPPTVPTEPEVPVDGGYDIASKNGQYILASLDPKNPTITEEPDLTEIQKSQMQEEYLRRLQKEPSGAVYDGESSAPQQLPPDIQQQLNRPGSGSEVVPPTGGNTFVRQMVELEQKIQGTAVEVTTNALGQFNKWYTSII